MVYAFKKEESKEIQKTYNSLWSGFEILYPYIYIELKV